MGMSSGVRPDRGMKGPQPHQLGIGRHGNRQACLWVRREVQKIPGEGGDKRAPVDRQDSAGAARTRKQKPRTLNAPHQPGVKVFGDRIQQNQRLETG